MMQMFAISDRLTAIQTDFTYILTTGEQQLNISICYDQGGFAGLAITPVEVDNSRINTETHRFDRRVEGNLPVPVASRAFGAILEWTSRWVKPLSDAEKDVIAKHIRDFCGV